MTDDCMKKFAAVCKNLGISGHEARELTADELGDRAAYFYDRVKQLESLLGRIHKATDQFYTKQKAGHCKKPDTTPYKDIIDLYHLILPDLPRVEKATEKRKAAMRQRWSNDLETLEDWTLYFKDAARKPFLFGRNDKGWVANFDFLLREQTITFMQEGKYG